MPQTRQTKLNALKRRVEAGTYMLKAEAIVDAVEQHIALHERPIGSLTPEEREVVTRILAYHNDQARQRIQEQDVDRLYPVSRCPVHQTLYPVKTNNRGQDCVFCRTEQENAPYRFEDLREEGGMVESLPCPGDDNDGAWTQADERWVSLVDGLLLGALALFALVIVVALVTGRLM